MNPEPTDKSQPTDNEELSNDDVNREMTDEELADFYDPDKYGEGFFWLEVDEDYLKKMESERG